MTPFDQDDALQQLLGQARPVQTKGNFTANVMRTVRNTPQERGRWAQLKGWWSDTPRPWAMPALAGAAALFVAMLSVGQPQPSTQPVVTATVEATSEAIAPLEDLDQMSALLAMEDTSSLTDQEIGLLLY
jgi:anti-sigma factor RsiW